MQETPRNKLGNARNASLDPFLLLLLPLSSSFSLVSLYFPDFLSLFLALTVWFKWGGGVGFDFLLFIPSLHNYSRHNKCMSLNGHYSCTCCLASCQKNQALFPPFFPPLAGQCRLLGALTKLLLEAWF